MNTFMGDEAQKTHRESKDGNGLRGIGEYERARSSNQHRRAMPNGTWAATVVAASTAAWGATKRRREHK